MPTIKELLRLRTPAPVVEPTAEELARHDEEVKRKQEEYSPLWRASEKVMRGGMGLIEGATGISDFTPGAPELEDKANALGQLLTSGIPVGKALGAGAKVLEAGLPFAAYKAKLPIKALAHGSTRLGAIERFDPTKNDKSDVLGWLTHAAEEPDYANDYALGSAKHGGTLNVPWKNLKTNETRSTMPAGVIPLELEAKNVLDLVDPNIDDMSHALAAVDKPQRRDLIKDFKRARKLTRESPDKVVDTFNISRDHYPPIPPKSYNEIQKQVSQELNLPLQEEDVYGQTSLDWLSIQPEGPEHIERVLDIYTEALNKAKEVERIQSESRKHLLPNLPAIVLAEKLRLAPHTLLKTQFDAVRYNDMNRKSWAWPETTPVKSKFGADLTPVPTDDPYSGAPRFNIEPGGEIVDSQKNIRAAEPLTENDALYASPEYKKLQDAFIEAAKKLNIK